MEVGHCLATQLESRVYTKNFYQPSFPMSFLGTRYARRADCLKISVTEDLTVLTLPLSTFFNSVIHVSELTYTTGTVTEVQMELYHVIVNGYEKLS